MSEYITIPGRCGDAAIVRAGERIKIVNITGEQVVDTWAFNRHDLGEFMSMEHTHTALQRVIPRVGDTFVTNRRQPILTVVADTSPGIHDTVIASCDRWRYQQLGCKGHHDNCTDNLHDALAALGLKAAHTPAPLNMWMNIPIRADGSLSFEPPVSKPGDHVLLEARMDAVVAFSACPQDMVPINGADCVPTEAHFQVV